MDEKNEQQFARRVFIASLAYLAMPYGIFILGYLRWYAALLALSALLAGCWLSFSRSSVQFEQGAVSITKKQGMGVLLVAFALLIISGVGGYGFQDGDWYKHDAILSALIRHEWPVAYSFKMPSPQAITHVPLIYYTAYYLPAAVIGKIFGWFWANQAFFLWTYLGVCLAICWFFLLVGKYRNGLLAVFFAFSGFDVIGIAVLRKFFLQEPLSIVHWFHIERWAGNWEYPSHMTSIFWSPNQGICAWIVSGMVLYEFLYAKQRHHLLFLLSLTVFWSPFVTLGFLPFLVGELLFEQQPFLRKVRAYFSMSALCGLVLILVFGLFYASKFYPSPVPFSPVEQGTIFSSPAFPGLFWYETLALLVLFCVLEYGVFALLIRQSRLPLNPIERRIFWVSVGVLSLLPFFRYGFWNDLVMRVSLPSLFFIAVFLARALYAVTTSARMRGLIVAALVIGALNVVVEVKRHVVETYRTGTLYTLPSLEVLYDIPDTKMIPSFFTQYIGSAESPFFTYLAKPPMPSPPNEILSVTTTERKP